MCTLTYIPIGSDDFFFTTNRDESPLREAEFPNEYHIGESFALYPKDKMAKGTWIMCHENDFSLCLLNGAFEKHKHEPPYKKSRGVMVLEFSEFASTIDFIRDYHFGGMEPFTLLVLRYKYTRNLEEIRWDGETFHYRKLDSSKPYIWSSSTSGIIKMLGKCVSTGLIIGFVSVIIFRVKKQSNFTKLREGMMLLTD